MATGKQRGFTLIELLAVLVIIVLTASLVSLNLPDFQRQNSEQQGYRLWQAGQLAQTEALSSGTLLALELPAGRFAFSRFENGEWQPVDTPELLQGESLADQFGWLLDDQPRSVVTTDETPRLLFWPDGTVSKFRLRLQQQGETLWTLSSDGLQLLWQMGDDEKS